MDMAHQRNDINGYSEGWLKRRAKAEEEGERKGGKQEEKRTVKVEVSRCGKSRKKKYTGIEKEEGKRYRGRPNRRFMSVAIQRNHKIKYNEG